MSSKTQAALVSEQDASKRIASAIRPVASGSPLLKALTQHLTEYKGLLEPLPAATGSEHPAQEDL